MFTQTGLTWAGSITVLCVVSGAITGARQGDESRAGDTTEDRFVVTGVPEIVVTNSTDGQTTLRAVDGNEVRVRITTDGWDRDDVDVDVRQDGNQIRIETRREEWRWFNWGRSPRVHIEIEAPRQSDIDARNDDGTLTVTGFEGRLSLSVDDGHLRVTDVSGELTARGDDGRLDLQRVTGSVDVRMDDGDLRVDGVLTVVRARADDGDLRIRAEPGSRMEADWSIRVDDAHVSLALPDDFAADLDIRTDDGRVDVEHPITMQGRNSRHRISGAINGGGYELRVHTDDGRVRITRE